MRGALVWVNVALRGAMEVGIVAALAWWGFAAGSALWSKIGLAVVAPAVGFGVWGAVDFRQAGRWAEPLRLIEELAISGLAVLGLFVSGRPGPGLALGGLSLAHHLLVYLLGMRLLKR